MFGKDKAKYDKRCCGWATIWLQCGRYAKRKM